MPLRTLGIVIARAQSKRLPGKNTRLIRGVPLVGYMAKAALGSKLDRVLLSTEDAGIASSAAEYGLEAPFRRPDELASDYASSYDIVMHALNHAEAEERSDYDAVVLMQPTTPFVQSSSIDACIDTLGSDSNLAMCFTARRTAEPPQWMMEIDEQGLASPMVPDVIWGGVEHTQWLRPTYLPNGAAYAVRTSALRNQKRFFCPPAKLIEMDAARSVDIDEELDLVVAEAVAQYFDFIPERPKQG